jgi:hypothetical protein
MHIQDAAEADDADDVRVADEETHPALGDALREMASVPTVEQMHAELTTPGATVKKAKRAPKAKDPKVGTQVAHLAYRADHQKPTPKTHTPSDTTNYQAQWE